jgi:hypothetical protein
MFLRFSIRDLMWLTLVIAALTAWWSAHERATRAGKQNNEVFKEMARLRGELEKKQSKTVTQAAAIPSSKSVGR